MSASAVAISLSPDQVREIIAGAQADLVRHLIARHKDSFDYISKAQAGGILDVSAKTLDQIPAKKLPRYNIGGTIRFRLSEVDRYLAGSKE